MPDLNATTESQTSVYAIFERSTNTVIYVGLTSYQRDGDRFVEHVNNDLGYPWHKSKVSPVAYAGDTDDNWPYYPRKLEDCKNFTPLETAAAEEYWWEQYGGLQGNLVNKQQPLRLATFNKYANASTYRGTAKGFPPGWAPKL